MPRVTSGIMGRPVRVDPVRMLFIAVQLLDAGGSANLTKENVAKLTGWSPGNVNSHFGGIKAFREAAWAEAVRQQRARAVAWGILEKIPVCRNVPYELRKKAADEILKG